MRSKRGKRRRLLGALLWGVAALQVVEAWRLRARRRDLRTLPASETSPGVEKLSVSAFATQVGPGTLGAVAEEMAAGAADVIDLVPGDLPAERALALLRRVDLDRLRDDPCYAPAGAAEAVAVHPLVAERIGLPTGVRHLDRGALVQRTIDAQRHAPYTRTVRVAPDLPAAAVGAADRWRELDALLSWTRPYLSAAGVVQAMELAWLALLTAGPWLAPLPGLAAVAAWSAQPALVFTSHRDRPPASSSGDEDVATDADATPPSHPGLRPPDLVRASLLRLPRAWVTGVATAMAGVRDGLARPESAVGAAGPAAPAVPSPSFEGRFEPRRDSCPWCGSSSLEQLVEVPDMLQNRPGTFHVDGCRDCGHVFQNPQLTVEGLDLAYSDAYGDVWEFMFSLCGPAYRNRARAVARFTQPARWLDVGCSLGLFFLVARQVFPETRFEGLDMGDTVEEGYRRGWSDAAHKGAFVDLAGSLPTYDVVSLHHYLEHTRDPRAELAAVDEVLEPGGHLMIEVPDPEAPWARRLGRYWPHWGQPQHLHLIPCDNLVDELTARGFQVLSVERATAMIPVDVTAALLMWVQSVSRPARVPWLPPPTPVDRLTRLAATAAVAPLVPLARAVDRADMARTLRTGAVSNVYRVVARKR